MIPLLELLNRSGFPCRWTPVEGASGRSLKFCYVETPFAKSLLESDAFIGVAFVDGAHTSSVTKQTMLATCTVTADHKIMPLAIAMVDGENNASYEFFMESMKAGAFGGRTQVTILADQHKSIEHGLKVFTEARDEDGDLLYDYIQLPCLHHLLKKVKGRRDFKELVVADHAMIYRARLARFKEEHKAEAERLEDVIEKISFKGSESQSHRCFGFLADSPVESMNAVLKQARKDEFFYLIPKFLEWALEQREKQLADLPDGDQTQLCRAALNIIQRRRALAEDLAVRREAARKYVVADTFSERITTEYTVSVDRNRVLSCHCEEWNRSGIPCKHIFAVASRYPGAGEMPPVRECYKVAKIREGLRDGEDMQVPATDDLEPIDIQMPQAVRPVGRPRSKRQRSLVEYLMNGGKLKRKCGYCQELATHTCRTCPQKKADEERAQQEALAARRRGRPPGSGTKNRSRSPAPRMTTRARASPERMATRSARKNSPLDGNRGTRQHTSHRRRPSPRRL